MPPALSPPSVTASWARHSAASALTFSSHGFTGVLLLAQGCFEGLSSLEVSGCGDPEQQWAGGKKEALALCGHGCGQWPWGACASLWVEREVARQLRGSAQGKDKCSEKLQQCQQGSKHHLVPVHPCEGGGRGQPEPLLCHGHSSPFLCAEGNLCFLPSQHCSRLNYYQMWVPCISH